jgi:hypothetical protein
MGTAPASAGTPDGQAQSKDPMSSSSDHSQIPIGPAQLNGWKEIAAYVGRSVRTVQRWEKDFGLPVRRFGLSRPESVFALPREIDAWFLTSQGLSARSGAASAEPAGGQADPGARAADETDERRPSPSDSRRLSQLAMGVLVVAAVATLGWAAWQSWRPGRPADQPPAPAATASPAPAEWHVDLDTLVVSDARGTVLWKYRFTRDLMQESYKGSEAAPSTQFTGIADLDGDGFREVWFIANFAGPWSPVNTALYVFEHDGRLRWTYQPSLSVRFGRETFGPSWFVTRVFVTADPDGGPGRALWGVLYDSALFPSALQRLDPRTGKPLSVFWSNGYVVTLALDLEGNRRRLILGSCNNEHKAASLVVLDAMNPNGSAPAETEKYRCMSCPAGDPALFLVFPKPARFRPSDQTGAVVRLSLLADGWITAVVQHALGGPAGSAVAIHTFDDGLNPRSVDTADEYLKVYQALVSQGAARAGAPASVDPDREFFPILRWDSAARRFVEVARRR